MNIVDIINKKRVKNKLTKEEIEFAVNAFVEGKIKDYQMASFLMAIAINGMTTEETIYLTDVMLNSGDIIDLSLVKGIKVDKHSTGGIGDKTTIILAPLVASLGVPVAKMSGQGLGFTGGTIDKLKSIPGMRTAMSETKFINQVNKIGLAIASGTDNLVPADKLIYALRDVTGTVSSIPLIASSIMSKKLASGADKIVIDVKVGVGALVKNITEAEKLANLMIRIGKKYDKETICVLTNMDEPLGCNVGNSLEVLEAIDVLKNKGAKDITDLVIYLGAKMVSLSKNISFENAKIAVINNLDNGQAYQKFEEMVKMQGGRLDKITVASKVFSIKSPKTGFIESIDALKIGKLVHSIGAGRLSKDDKIDYEVGVSITKKTGDFVTEGEELIKVYLNKIDTKMSDVLDCFQINELVSKQPRLIYEVID